MRVSPQCLFGPQTSYRHPSAPNDHCRLLCPCVRLEGCDSGTDGVMTSAEWKYTSRQRGNALDDAPPQWIFPTSSGGSRYGGQQDGEVKEGQTSSACWLCRLGFKVGQLMPGSSRAKWTSLVAVWGGVLEEPPGSRGCQGDVKHSKCSKKEARSDCFTKGPVCRAESFTFLFGPANEF